MGQTRSTYQWGLLGAVVGLAACSGAEDEFATSERGVPPATHNAAVVSVTGFPALAAPGEKLDVQVVMQNTGVSSPTDDWLNANYFLYSTSPVSWGFVNQRVAGTIRANPFTEQSTHNIVVKAPAATNSFRARVFRSGAVGGGFFGAQADSGPITIMAGAQRRWSCLDTGNPGFPATMTPGEARSVTVQVQNNGYATWPAAGLCLYSRDATGVPPNINLWGGSATCVPVTAAVASTGTFDFTFNVTAPTTPGTYTFRRQIFDSRPIGVGLFDDTAFCFERTIVVGAGTLARDSAIFSENFLTTMQTNETTSVTVVMQNTGTETWSPANFILYNRNTPVNFWGGVSHAFVGPDVAPGQNATFTFNITAPGIEGAYEHRWQMYKSSGPGAGFFGALVNVPVQVQNAAQPQFGATVISQTIPGQVAANSPATFIIEMQNTGVQPWTGSSFQLASVNVPNNRWLTTAVALGAAETVAPGATRVFSFGVVSPAAAGLYSSQWQMRNNPGVGLFGEVAVTNGIIVGDCGNGVINAGETCDDANLNAGDGCGATCQVEPRTVDLLATTPDRRFSGNQIQLSNTAIGDVTGDGVPEVIMADASGFFRAAGPGAGNIGAAGRVYAHSSANFFDATNTTAGAGPSFLFEVRAADTQDRLGGGALSGLVISDVTGDGTDDLVISAANADGVGNLRSGCGEIFVVEGGPGLAGAGIVDLYNFEVPAAPIVARIVGPRVDDAIMILSAGGDVDGDGINDLLIGIPGDDTNGANAGAAMVLRGGAALTGVIDLLTDTNPEIIGIVRGAAADDQLGRSGVIGDMDGGAGSADVAVGAPRHTPLGRTQAGGVWGMFGPLAARTFDLAAAGFDFRFQGGAANNSVGRALAVGNVTGGAELDLVIGSSQTRNPANGNLQVGSVDIYVGPIVAGTVDMNATAPTARFFGHRAGDLFGQTIALGDMNQDGFADIATGASGYDGVSFDRNVSGQVVAVLGGAALPAVTDLNVTAAPFRVVGALANGLMGSNPFSVALGDLNNDGRLDLAAGTFNNNPGRVDFFRTPW